MLIYIGADHRGYQLKERLKVFLKDQGYEIVDVGDEKYDEHDDYPDFASLVGRAISQDPLTRKGIVICRSGAGVDIVANKFRGVRSVLAFNADQAYLSRNDDDTNVLALPAEFLTDEIAHKIIEVWLQTPFSNDENCKRRLDKIGELENRLIS